MRPSKGDATDKPAFFALIRDLPGRLHAFLEVVSVYRFYRWGSTAPARTRGSRTPGRRSRTPRSAPRYLVRSGTIRRARAVNRGGGGGQVETRFPIKTAITCISHWRLEKAASSCIIQDLSFVSSQTGSDIMRGRLYETAAVQRPSDAKETPENHQNSLQLVHARLFPGTLFSP